MKYFPIDKSLFIENRKRFEEKLKSASVAVFTSNDVLPTNADGVMPFRQNNDLYYLTGIDQEDTIFVSFPDCPNEKHRNILFIKETNEHIATWEGNKLTKKEAEELSGIGTIYWTHQFDSIFRSIVFLAENIYLNFNEHTRADKNIVTREERLIKNFKLEFPLHHFERSAPILTGLRSIKNSLEIETIKKAIDITAKAFERVLKFVKPGVWEFEIEAEIQHEFLRNRSRGPAYQSIIASGANACILHYIQNNQKCRDGDLILMDFGAEYANYASDLTRCIPVNGRFSPRQKEVYKSVLKVMNDAKKLLVPRKFIQRI